MGLQITVELEREAPNMILGHVEGKDLSRAMMQDERKILAPLLAFSSVTAAQLVELEEMNEEFEIMEGHPFPQIEWFEAAPALDALRQVELDLRARPDAFGTDSEDLFEGVLEDLDCIARELRQAANFGVRFHLVGEF